MNDVYVSRASVLGAALWVVAGMMAALVWVLALLGAPLRYEIAVVILTNFALAAASLYQVRVYSTRLCALVRVVSGLESPDAELHSIRGRQGSS